MKRTIAWLLVVILLLSVPAYAVTKKAKSLEVTVFGFTFLYELCMEMFEQETSVSRDWVDDDTAMIQLNKQSYVMVDTESKSDYGNIVGALFVAAPENAKDKLAARYSMLSTIYSFDSELGLEKIVDLVLNVLPQNGEYISSYCQYKYVETYNVMMLTISPK